MADRAGARAGGKGDGGGPGGGGPGGAASGLGAGRGLAPLEKAAFRITRASYCWFYLYAGSHLSSEAFEVVADGIFFLEIFGGGFGSICGWKFCKFRRGFRVINY